MAGGGGRRLRLRSSTFSLDCALQNLRCNICSSSHDRMKDNEHLNHFTMASRRRMIKKNKTKQMKTFSYRNILINVNSTSRVT